VKYEQFWKFWNLPFINNFYSLCLFLTQPYSLRPSTCQTPSTFSCIVIHQWLDNCDNCIICILLVLPQPNSGSQIFMWYFAMFSWHSYKKNYSDTLWRWRWNSYLWGNYPNRPHLIVTYSVWSWVEMYSCHLWNRFIYKSGWLFFLL